MRHIDSEKVLDAHNKAFLTNFEIACEAGIFALIADLLWLTHDIAVNGMSYWYGAVLGGLSLGLLFTIFALYRHHRSYTHRIMRKLVRR